MARRETDGRAENRPTQPDRIEKRGGYSPAKVTELSQVSNPSRGPAPGADQPKAESAKKKD